MPTELPRAALEQERDNLKAQLIEHGGIEYDENFADSGQVARFRRG